MRFHVLLGALLASPFAAVVLASCPDNAEEVDIAGTTVCCPGQQVVESSGGYCVINCGKSDKLEKRNSCTSVAVTASDYSQSVFGTSPTSAPSAGASSLSQGGAAALCTQAPLMAMAGAAVVGAAML